MHIVIFTGGQFEKSRLVTQAIELGDMIIAADSGADTALRFGITPEFVVGDMDSIDQKISENLKKLNVKFITSPSEKDETDTQLAIDFAMQKGATEITLLAGTQGDRIDHILGNIFYACVSTIPIRFINGMQESFVAKGPCEKDISGKKYDLLSLIPLREDVEGLRSKGLQWELRNETLLFGLPRGVSNVFLEKSVHVSFSKGTLFVTHTHQE